MLGKEGGNTDILDQSARDSVSVGRNEFPVSLSATSFITITILDSISATQRNSLYTENETCFGCPGLDDPPVAEGRSTKPSTAAWGPCGYAESSSQRRDVCWVEGESRGMLTSMLCVHTFLTPWVSAHNTCAWNNPQPCWPSGLGFILY